MKNINWVRIKFLLVTLCAVVMVFGMITSASASLVNIDLSNPNTFPGLVAYGNETSQSDINSIISSKIGTSTELYKATPGNPVAEVGSLAGSYQTIYLPAGQKEDAEITYVGGYIVGPVAYLLAKDGNANDIDPNTHAWFLYNLTYLGWTGTEVITIQGLWPNQGDFSHVTLYGGSGNTVPPPPVPVPPSVWLLGSGLIGLIGLRRRFFRK